MARYILGQFTCLQAVIHPSSNWAQCRLTTLIKPTHSHCTMSAQYECYLSVCAVSTGCGLKK